MWIQVRRDLASAIGKLKRFGSLGDRKLFAVHATYKAKQKKYAVSETI